MYVLDELTSWSLFFKPQKTIQKMAISTPLSKIKFQYFIRFSPVIVIITVFGHRYSSLSGRYILSLPFKIVLNFITVLSAFLFRSVTSSLSHHYPTAISPLPHRYLTVTKINVRFRIYNFLKRVLLCVTKRYKTLQSV